MHWEILEKQISTKTVFSHPGITFDPKKKERFQFSKESKEILKQFIENRFQWPNEEEELSEQTINVDKTTISTAQVQATVDWLLSKWKSEWKILRFLERVWKIFHNTDTKPSSKFPEKIREKIEKNTKDERLDIYLKIDEEIIEVPLIIWKWAIRIDHIISTFNTRYGYSELIGGRKNK